MPQTRRWMEGREPKRMNSTWWRKGQYLSSMCWEGWVISMFRSSTRQTKPKREENVSVTEENQNGIAQDWEKHVSKDLKPVLLLLIKAETTHKMWISNQLSTANSPWKEIQHILADEDPVVQRLHQTDLLCLSSFWLTHDRKNRSSGLIWRWIWSLEHCFNGSEKMHVAFSLKQMGREREHHLLRTRSRWEEKGNVQHSNHLSTWIPMSSAIRSDGETD